MNKLLTRLIPFLAITLIVVSVATTQACHKNKPCKAIITVVDSANGTPLAGAEVKLMPSGSCQTCQTITPIVSTSDASGKTSFETELPKIMDIYVNGNVTGKVVRFEEGKTDEVTVSP